MISLTEHELENPGVAPFAAFIGALPHLVSSVEDVQPAKFLDIGCGVGGYGELLERYQPGRFAYIGADFSPAVIAAARTRWPGRRSWRPISSSLERSTGYDVVFASALVDVLPDPIDALESLFASDAPVVFLHRQQLSRLR